MNDTNIATITNALDKATEEFYNAIGVAREERNKSFSTARATYRNQVAEALAILQAKSETHDDEAQ